MDMCKNIPPCFLGDTPHHISPSSYFSGSVYIQVHDILSFILYHG
jgi:hypothetical protein